ncbi:MAG: SMI1/KNR4 family protein [Heteroscytonema crispum UTEX LB 1556]
MIKVLQLKNKLTQLALLDKTFEVFGSESHQYKLNPCLPEAKIQAFESKYNIKLPSDYRDFLLEVGDGGAGPGYGLLGIGYESEIREILQVEDDEFLSQSFPLKEAWNDLGLVKQRVDSAINYNPYFDNKLVQGTLTIAHYGCGIYAMLVITGEQRGNIWIDDRTNDSGIYPASPNFCHFFHDEEPDDFPSDEDEVEPVSFYYWYDDWLNRSLRQVSQ